MRDKHVFRFKETIQFWVRGHCQENYQKISNGKEYIRVTVDIHYGVCKLSLGKMVHKYYTKHIKIRISFIVRNPNLNLTVAYKLTGIQLYF